MSHNPRGTVKTNFQHPFSTTVWWCMIDSMLTGPGILDDHMTRQLPRLPTKWLTRTRGCSFGCTECYVVLSAWENPFSLYWLLMQHLNDTFPNRWIGHGTAINWAPRSPDLTHLDLCSWSCMRSKGYRRKVDTRDELLGHIMVVLALIKESQDALRRTIRHVLTRIPKCMVVDGEIFENILH